MEIVGPWVLAAEGKRAVNIKSGMGLLVDEGSSSTWSVYAYHLGYEKGHALLATFGTLTAAKEAIKKIVTETKGY